MLLKILLLTLKLTGGSVMIGLTDRASRRSMYVWENGDNVHLYVIGVVENLITAVMKIMRNYILEDLWNDMTAISTERQYILEVDIWYTPNCRVGKWK